MVSPFIFTLAGERPQWEEQNEPFYHLGQKTCIILLKSFCWIKFEIDNEIVEGKRLKLYTAAKKMYLGDKCVAVHVGYHLDMPGEQEVCGNFPFSCPLKRLLFLITTFLNPLK